ncbi:unnamed protein product (macronuclear) [Paramecium tetraurelia]|uniref:Uncharacterized protein n=1 Tax=Paramecium tetraurelia TaxID=5888 RepID=A0CM19_PARTE|nr:uncharacterized protein GSPATT00008315001 [Paramecium tetraurelia]CAK71836.1 unnamed protein product [Paramecium tetraurelia]|eukprot:XP_001439233.1 hypothetical protein (macronuclear) [Paramecium tetraurelia strain d4-2]
MVKHSRTKNSNQATEGLKNSRYRKQDNIKKEVGKPPNIDTILIQIPNIWSTDKQIQMILAFLYENGRHISIHLAGAKRNSKNEQDEFKRKLKEEKQRQIKNSQPTYEFLVNFCVEHLGYPESQQKKSRIIVFFFRHNTQPLKKYIQKKYLSIQNTQWYQYIKKFYFLLDEQFRSELIKILELIDKQQTIEQIATYQIETFLATQYLQDIQVIFKNLLVQIIKSQEDEDLNKYTLTNCSSAEIFEIYKKKIYFYQNRVIEFISKLKLLFNNQDPNQFQHTLYNEEQKYGQPDPQISIYYDEEEYLNSDQNIMG